MATVASLGNYFSAATATVVLDNEQVGELQNITIEEDYGMRPVNEIGSSYTNMFIPGVYSGRMRAQRALLEIDRIYQTLIPNVDKSSIENLVDQVIGDVASIRKITDINELIIERLTLFQNRAKTNRYSHTLTFDVQILSSDEDEFIKLEGCIINSRKLTTSVGNVAILQDIDILFRKRTT